MFIELPQIELLVKLLRKRVNLIWLDIIETFDWHIQVKQSEYVSSWITSSRIVVDVLVSKLKTSFWDWKFYCQNMAKGNLWAGSCLAVKTFCCYARESCFRLIESGMKPNIYASRTFICQKLNLFMNNSKITGKSFALKWK